MRLARFFNANQLAGCLSLLIASLVILPTISAARQAEENQGKKSLNKQATKLAKSLHLLSRLEAIEQIGAMVKKASPEDFAAADRHVAEQRLGYLSEHYANILVELARFSSLPKSLKWSVKEARLLTSIYEQQIQRLLADIEKVEFMATRLVAPSRYPDYVSLFWNIHVMRNRVKHVQLMTQVCRQQPKKIRNRRGEEFGMPRDYDELQTRLTRLAKEVHEREIELRIYRMEDSAIRLKESNSAKEKLEAGFAIGHDLTAINEFFSSVSTEAIGRENLKDESVKKSVDQSLAMAKTYGAEQIQKGTKLMVGLHWWLRGRYGHGATANGLLKPENAMKSEQAMFALIMPTKFYEPEKPRQPYYGSHPTYERRHYFHWILEKREVTQALTLSGSSTTTESSVTTDSKSTHRTLDRFY